METKEDQVNEEELSKIRFEFYGDILKDIYQSKTYNSTRLDIVYLALFIINITVYSRIEISTINNKTGVLLSIAAIFIHVAELIYHANRQNNMVINLENALLKALKNGKGFGEIRLKHSDQKSYIAWTLLIRIINALLLFASLYLVTL